jgi:hypothetical protein
VGSEAANELVPLVSAEDQAAILAVGLVKRTTGEQPDVDVRAPRLVAETKVFHHTTSGLCRAPLFQHGV